MTASRSLLCACSRFQCESRSDLVMRPPGPLPFTASRSVPRSLAMRSASGVARIPSLSGACPSSWARYASMSLATIAPLGPLPVSSERSIDFSSARRRARGVARMRPSSWTSGAATRGPDGADGSSTRAGVGAAAGRLAGAGLGAAGAGFAAAGAAAAAGSAFGCAAGASSAATAPSASPGRRSTAIKVPTGTVAPASTTICASVPSV